MENINEEKLISTILYVIVMNEESSALLDKENFVKDETLSGEFSNILESFILLKNSKKTIIIRPKDDPFNKTGLFGTEIAFFLAYTGIKFYSPDIVISMGYAGDTGSEKIEINTNENITTDINKLKHGTVVIAKEKSLYHRREMIIKFYEKTSEGHYPVLSCDKLVKELGFASHYVGTSNSFCKHDNVAVIKNIKVVEMELCSVARACTYFNVPCVGVKLISDSGDDVVDEKERERQFMESLTILRNKFYETFGILNEFLLNKKINEL